MQVSGYGFQRVINRGLAFHYHATQRRGFGASGVRHTQQRAFGSREEAAKTIRYPASQTTRHSSSRQYVAVIVACLCVIRAVLTENIRSVARTFQRSLETNSPCNICQLLACANNPRADGLAIN